MLVQSSVFSLLMETLGGGIYRRERFFYGWRIGFVDSPVLRVDQLITLGSIAHLSETSQSCTGHKVRPLRVGEVKKSQGDTVTAIAQTDEQRPTSAESYLRVFDFAFDDRRVPRSATCDGRDAGSVLVTDGQVKQQILHLVYTQPCEALGSTWTDARQRRNWHLVQIVRWFGAQTVQLLRKQ